MRDEFDIERDEVVQRHGDLEIEDNMDAQRRLWKVQRVGRGIALVVLALALAGGFGGGPLSDHKSSIGGHSLEYERIGYRDSSQVYRLKVSNEVVQAGPVRIWIDQQTLARIKLEAIVPEPTRSMLAADRVIFEFEIRDTTGQAQILFDFQPTKAGIHSARIGVEGGPTFEPGQLFLP